MEENTGGEIFLRYYAAAELEPLEPDRYFVWLENGLGVVAYWSGSKWLTEVRTGINITGQVYFWASIPNVGLLESNYGKNI